MSQPADIAAIHRECERLQGQPYVYGGGGDPEFLPTIGDTDGPVKGYDCSKILSAAIHAGAPEEMPRPLGTHELERWGLPSVGDWFTVWVVNGMVNGIPTEHCVAEFMKGVPASHRFFTAFFTGGPPAGFLPNFPTTHYHPRRKVAG